MKVLILGGTGAMGTYLVQIFSSKGIETTVTSRNVQQSQKNVRYIQGNALKQKFLQEILQDRYDAIVDFMSYNTETFLEHAALLLRNTSQYVFLSTARVYGNEDMPITETSPRLLESSDDREYLQTDEYALTKARQENILIDSGVRNWTIIRPYITYGDYRLQLGTLEKETWLFRALLDRTIIFPKEVSLKTTTLTYGLDVAKGIAAILGEPNVLGETFQITTNKHETWIDVWNIYSKVLEKHLGRSLKMLPVDLDEFLNIFPKENQYQIVYDRLFDRVFDSSKISKYVAVDKFIDPRNGLVSCLEEFLKKPVFRKIDWQVQKKMDILARDFA